jgi:predicted thioesterase
MKSGSLPVFATPSMTALMEQAACACLDECDVGATVGTALNIEHVAASPIGAEITATATITSVSGRKYEFAVTARDSAGEIGRGTHTRVAIDAEKFMKKAEERRS